MQTAASLEQLQSLQMILHEGPVGICRTAREICSLGRDVATPSPQPGVLVTPRLQATTGLGLPGITQWLAGLLRSSSILSAHSCAGIHLTGSCAEKRSDP